MKVITQTDVENAVALFGGDAEAFFAEAHEKTRGKEGRDRAMEKHFTARYKEAVGTPGKHPFKKRGRAKGAPTEYIAPTFVVKYLNSDDFAAKKAELYSRRPSEGLAVMQRTV